jgi:hypothetical protein
VASHSYLSALWSTAIKWSARVLKGSSALAIVLFLAVTTYGLATGHDFPDAVAMAWFVMILIVATPISLITTGRLPYIDL